VCIAIIFILSFFSIFLFSPDLLQRGGRPQYIATTHYDGIADLLSSPQKFYHAVRQSFGL
jgi:hypothetical protein